MYSLVYLCTFSLNMRTYSTLFLQLCLYAGDSSLGWDDLGSNHEKGKEVLLSIWRYIHTTHSVYTSGTITRLRQNRKVRLDICEWTGTKSSLPEELKNAQQSGASLYWRCSYSFNTTGKVKQKYMSAETTLHLCFRTALWRRMGKRSYTSMHA